MNTSGNKDRISVHQRVAEYYEDKAHPAPKNMDDLTNAIEAFHHTIQARDYEQANRIYKQRINIRDTAGNYLMPDNQGAFELDFSLISQLFPDGDTSQEPLIASAGGKAWLISDVGICMMKLGRLAEAALLFQRYIQKDLALKDWGNASIGSYNLCEIQLKWGNLPQGEATARQALAWAQRANSKDDELNSLAYCAYAAFLQGKNEEAGKLFKQANDLEWKRDPTLKWLCSTRGIWYAKFLARSGKRKLADEITQENLTICQREGWPDDISRCYRLLAGFCLERQDYKQAEEHLHSGLQIARNIGLQEEIAKLQLGFARLYLARNDLPQADAALKETLSICTRCGYKIIEIDARNVLAQIRQAEGKIDEARTEAQSAYDMSRACGYYWGQSDAQRILELLDKKE